MPDRAVEDAACTIALDPDQAVVLVRTDLPVTQIRLIRVDADQHMQLLSRVGAGGQEVIELIRVDKAVSPELRSERAGGKLPCQWAVGIVNLQRRRLNPVRTGLRADQISELRNIRRGVACSMQASDSAAFAHKAREAILSVNADDARALQILAVAKELAAGEVAKALPAAQRSNF